MKILLIIFLSFFSVASWGQYYYDDIIATGETSQLIRSYISNKVRQVSATGYDRKNTRANDFSEFSEIRDNGKTLRVSNVTNFTKKVVNYRYDEQQRLVEMRDSLTPISNHTKYNYDAAGRITVVENVVKDSANFFNQVETHTWFYDDQGRPIRMWRVLKNEAMGNVPDSLEVRFVKDEDGNIGEERTYRKGKETSYLYYYYNDQNLLSDIVRFNKKLNKLIPDIMFEYDEAGRVIQKITTTSDRVVGYLIWRYVFDNRGLKTTEALFDNNKQLTGKIQYTYTFGG